MTPNLFLPNAGTPEEFESALRDELQLRKGVVAICGRHSLGTADIVRFAEGSLPVYAIGDSLVLKFYPPYELAGRDTESLALQVVERCLPIPTPAVLATGELDGWGYLLMERLKGVSLASAWPQIPGEDRLRIADQIGEALAALHAVRDPRLGKLQGDWDGFIQAQRHGCVERQRARGLEERWLAQIPGFIKATPLGSRSPSALLHTEVMREHLLVVPGDGGWRISGLFDFEPAMIGVPEYEFVAVGLFVSCCDPTLLRRILLGYGYAGEELDAGLQNRLLAYALLHRYSNLPWYLRRLPPPEGVCSLEDLAAYWWGF